MCWNKMALPSPCGLRYPQIPIDLIDTFGWLAQSSPRTYCLSRPLTAMIIVPQIICILVKSIGIDKLWAWEQHWNPAYNWNNQGWSKRKSIIKTQTWDIYASVAGFLFYLNGLRGSNPIPLSVRQWHGHGHLNNFNYLTDSFPLSSRLTYFKKAYELPNH